MYGKQEMCQKRLRKNRGSISRGAGWLRGKGQVKKKEADLLSYGGGDIYQWSEVLFVNSRKFFR